MKYKLGDVLCIKDKTSALWNGGGPIKVQQKCNTQGQWVDDSSVEYAWLNKYPYTADAFDYFEATESKSKFRVGDKVISITDTLDTPEGFIGIVNEIDSDEFPFPIRVVNEKDVSELFKEHELELLNRREQGVVQTIKVDAVNSPKHYAVFEDVEAIQVIASSMTKDQFYGYCLGNILKYRLRAGGKDDVMQELGKADKYQELFTQYKSLCKESK